ncbi:hypothetical protein A2X44_03055 [candidate division CPR3 bacterium GWF2_35_18]|uniref:Dihydrofolate reductase n=1 Tax=candidate division CPR3 bacterium GW2011_GWF2_35_18 TaxID=1618350 RepID=A0A0G0BJ13_UNCC3|nr:MAG: Dihydrofolate reductase [candidate division CPR3 bacterium GW2011_GWF2_35_18]KKR76452.1 MAG: Dihydrofolate reductase [Parcubacteria group bacterium GW2011_GWE2_40_8]OGB62956.1 MAG: hypothetical protein A2X44_03055 [candidate division CPR3 bacterium GWF2_35_18]OGB65918.1 MAG: hypothetical protein A2250_03335 [candidate division CPR3 bacterium RIFOXYA2_FULL_35_13]OGB75894.1 MAG: hypothetical protein A2476_04685 [candidate division CPR3 bacterium RIFOXYC2_FULL_35_7]OGB79262.1 MAG: hypothe
MNSKPTISIIVAIGPNREIGNGNNLLWHISEDFKRFKTLTTNHPIIMGRKTFESIGKPLLKRTNIVITRDPSFSQNGIIVANSLENALEEAKNIDQKEIFIIGGGQIYQQAMIYANKLYLTEVKGNFNASIFFPEYSKFKKVIWESDWRKENQYEFRFLELTK